MAANDAGKLPTQIDGIFDGSVVAKATGGREQMRGVAGDEHTATLKSLGDERKTRCPCSTRQYFKVERGAYRCAKHRGGAPVRNLMFILVRPQLGVESEFTLAVHRGHEGAALTIERNIHPGRRVGNNAIKIRRAQVYRMHAAAEEVAQGFLVSHIVDSKRLAYRAARPVGADKIGCVHCASPSVGNPFDQSLNCVPALGKTNEAPAKIDGDAWKPFGMPAQDLLDEFLRDTVRKLCSAPGA